MQFKNAAYEILKKESKPLHYNEITNKAIAAGLLESVGKPLTSRWRHRLLLWSG